MATALPAQVRILDLYAGTGSLGIEALSRGASECIFVDNVKECVDCCIANAWAAGFLDHEVAAMGTLSERMKAEIDPVIMVGGPRASVAIERHRAQVANAPVGAIHADVLDVLRNPEEHGIVGRTFNVITVSPDYNAKTLDQSPGNQKAPDKLPRVPGGIQRWFQREQQ
ncbi:unnamed protein product [Prorocentrum cordatum]|uniref:Trimethylguanosine synthase n=1 Tax=Prorocentrum cordatum TaxID=2364126 RepID=A0ABN9QNP4_9DINO|nr:unnamed protein product [Polarella glacialis]